MIEPKPGRRAVLAGAAGLALITLAPPVRAAQPPRARVILDNDYSGDPDGLFQLAHHLLSPSVTIPLVIGSHIHVGDFMDGSARQADNAAEAARSLAGLLGVPVPPILAGRNTAPAHGAPPQRTPAVDRILAEALRTDTNLPLYYCAGAGLTELAEAVRIAPEIGRRITLIWIGGSEWPDLNPELPARTDAEYNLTIDAAAVETLFNASDVTIWQVPRNAYRQLTIGMAELEAELASGGPAGAYLLDALQRVRARFPDRLGETYILGDSPLVTLTALQTPYEPDSASSLYVIRPTPMLGKDGSYRPDPKGRPMRVYRTIDTRLTFTDLFAKLRAAAR
ncbi:nucleoside hydrolase [Sphingomonas sp. HT-1]|uniref:nucleoside hydrolase n=1 Tax=unclassified Sphingomonas TaxID=196159 RepID=UPI0002FE91EA|nr:MULTISPECIES: nucleoside hydrolase [unclassified Sphingomonas]KTF68800.1 nucleoside hydrolase [Sphingomonas sp. WG]